MPASSLSELKSDEEISPVPGSVLARLNYYYASRQYAIKVRDKKGEPAIPGEDALIHYLNRIGLFDALILCAPF